MGGLIGTKIKRKRKHCFGRRRGSRVDQMEQGMSMNSSVPCDATSQGELQLRLCSISNHLTTKTHITLNDFHLLWNTLVLEYSQCVSSLHISGVTFYLHRCGENCFFFFFLSFSPSRRPSAIVPFLFHCSSRSKRCSASIVCLRVRCIITEVWIINWSVEYIWLNDSVVCTLSLQAGCGVKCEYFFYLFIFILIICSACDVLVEVKTRPSFELLVLFGPFTFSQEAFWEM